MKCSALFEAITRFFKNRTGIFILPFFLLFRLVLMCGTRPPGQQETKKQHEEDSFFQNS